MAKQITFRERGLIELWLKLGRAIRDIAGYLDRSPSSICSEIKRNGDVGGYKALSAQIRSEKRISKSRSTNSLKQDWIINYMSRPAFFRQNLAINKAQLFDLLAEILLEVFNKADKELSAVKWQNLNDEKAKTARFLLQAVARGEVNKIAQSCFSLFVGSGHERAMRIWPDDLFTKQHPIDTLTESVLPMLLVSEEDLTTEEHASIAAFIAAARELSTGKVAGTYSPEDMLNLVR